MLSSPCCTCGVGYWRNRGLSTLFKAPVPQITRCAGGARSVIPVLSHVTPCRVQPPFETHVPKMWWCKSVHHGHLHLVYPIPPALPPPLLPSRPLEHRHVACTRRLCNLGQAPWAKDARLRQALATLLCRWTLPLADCRRPLPPLYAVSFSPPSRPGTLTAKQDGR